MNDYDFIILLNEALSDWPVPVLDIWDYYFQVKNKIKATKVTKLTINNYLNSNIVKKNSMWYDESLCVIRLILNSYEDDIDLENIFNDKIELINKEIEF